MRAPPLALLLVGVGGALGGTARWALGTLAPASLPASAWATMGINVAGSFLLALLPAWAPVRRSRSLALLAGPGLLGGFTTLSGYAGDARRLLSAGHHGLAAAYLVGTLGACLLAIVLARLFAPAAPPTGTEPER